MMDVFEDINPVQAFLNGQITFLMAFLTDFKAFLPVCAVLDAMEASGEGDEGNGSAIAESWCMATDQDTANPLVFQWGGECQNES